MASECADCKKGSITACKLRSKRSKNAENNAICHVCGIQMNPDLLSVHLHWHFHGEIYYKSRRVVRPPIMKRKYISKRKVHSKFEENNNKTPRFVSLFRLCMPWLTLYVYQRNVNFCLFLSSYHLSNEKLHECQRCSYASTNNSNLCRHIESFHVIYHCRYCPKICQGRKELSSHLRKDHKIKSTLRDYFNQNDTVGQRVGKTCAVEEEEGKIKVIKIIKKVA